MDLMRHKDSVDEIVKTGKAIMDSKNQEERDILKVKICQSLRILFLYVRNKSKFVVFFCFRTGQDSVSLGKVWCCQSAKLGTLSPAGTSSVSCRSILGNP